MNPYNSKVRETLEKNLFQKNIVIFPPLLFDSEIKKFKSPNLLFVFAINMLSIMVHKWTFCSKKDIRLLEKIDISKNFIDDISGIICDSYQSTINYIIPSVDLSSEKIVVYSVLTGNYDKVIEVLCKSNNTDYILFTNNPLITSRTWKVVYIQSDMNNVLLSRHIKMLPHLYFKTDYTASIYVDANSIIFGDISKLCAYLYPKYKLAVTKHSDRDNVLDEILACVKYGKLQNADEALRKYEGYTKEGFKDDMGLLECTILIRRHNDKELQRVMEEWWQEFRTGPQRDQLSILPCIHRLNFTAFKAIDGNVWNNQFVSFRSHKNSKNQ